MVDLILQFGLLLKNLLVVVGTQLVTPLGTIDSKHAVCRAISRN